MKTVFGVSLIATWVFLIVLSVAALRDQNWLLWSGCIIGGGICLSEGIRLIKGAA